MKNDFHTLITNMKALRIFSGSMSGIRHLQASICHAAHMPPMNQDFARRILIPSKSFLLSTMFRCRIWSMHLWKS